MERLFSIMKFYYDLTLRMDKTSDMHIYSLLEFEDVFSRGT